MTRFRYTAQGHPGNSIRQSTSTKGIQWGIEGIAAEFGEFIEGEDAMAS
jgi:hypothetical protein